MGHPEATTVASWWHLRTWKRQWQRWRRALYALFWPVLLAFVSLALHLYLANRAVVLWAGVQTLRAENWQLWWDIQTLAVLYAERQQRALEAYVQEQDWRWPDPALTLFLRPDATPVPMWGVSTWTLPPVTMDTPVRYREPAASRSLWQQLWLWWHRYRQAWRSSAP